MGLAIFEVMGIHRLKSTLRQELIGRLALVVLGLFSIWGGINLGWFCAKVLLGVAEFTEMDGAARFFMPLAVVSLFLLLVGLVCLGMAFVPGRDSRRGPPRGFQTVSRVFDAFWSVVRETIR